MSLLTEIKAAFPALTQANRDDAAIAAALSAGRTRTVSRLIGIGTVLDTLGPTPGAALLDGLNALGATVSAVKWAMTLLDRGELDIGLSSTKTELDQIVAMNLPFLSAAQAQTLKALAQVSDPVTEFDVRCALQDASGTWLG